MFSFNVSTPLWECSLSLKGITLALAFARFSLGLVHVDLMENRHENLNAVILFFMCSQDIYSLHGIRYTSGNVVSKNDCMYVFVHP